MPGIVAVWNQPRTQDGNPGVRQALQSLTAPGCGPFHLLPGLHCAMGSVLQSYLPQDTDPSLSDKKFLSDSLPMVAECRLDNRPELVALLGLTASEELSDTDILTLAWRHWGESCVEHLVGGFAFIVWDEISRRLFAARDPVGECPLFYYQSEGVAVVASLPRAILAVDCVPLRFDDQHIGHWLGLNNPARDSCFFAGITRLPPGCLLRLTSEKAEVRQYWHPSDSKPIRFKRDEDYAEGMRQVLDRATRERLRSRGGVSAQLSSGLDSSSVASSAALQLAQLGRSLTAYTAVPQAGFQDRHRNTNIYFDEGDFAAEVAGMYPNMKHVRVSSEGLPMLEIIKRWTDAMDEPILNGTNIVWIDTILRLTRENGSDIMFQGTMGNANISYETLRIMAQFLRQGRWFALAQTVYRHRASGFMSLRHAARVTFQDLYPARLSRNVREQREAFSLDFSPIHPGFSQEQGVFEATMERHTAREMDIAEERRIFYERFDMAPLSAAARTLHNVDPRDPTSDKLVWEYTYAVPPEQFVAEGHSRSLIRRAMRGRLPPATLARYARGYQGSDWYYNIRAALPAMREELEAMEASPASTRYLDLPRLKHLIDTFPESGFQRAQVFNPYHFALLRGITLGYFLRSWEAKYRA